MPFTFKLSRRLALVFAALTGGALVGCSVDVPSSAVPVVSDPLSAVGDSLFSDGFESGVLAWDDNFRPLAKQIVTAAARTGTRGLRVTFTPTANGGVLSKFVGRGTRVYFRAAVRFPTNWTGATSLLTLRAAPEANPWAGFGKAWVCPSGDTWAVTGLTTATANLDQRFNTYHVGMPASGGSCQPNAGLSGPSLAAYTAPLAVSKGVWHVVEIEAQLNTVGQADGWQRMWLDGRQTGEWTGLTFRTSSAVSWNAVSLELTSTGVTQTQTLDFDDILVGRQRSVAVAVGSVQVAPASATLNTGGTVGLTATVRDAAGNLLTGRAVTWSSNQAGIATVNATGVVTGVVAGTATITATSEGQSGSSTITVQSAAPAPQVLLSEGFDDAAFGSRGWYDFATTPVVTTGDKHSGTGSLQVRWSAGATAPPMKVMRKLFPATDRLYVSYWVKYSTNYVGSGKTYHPHEFNILSDKDQDWDGLTFNYLSTYIEQNYQNGGIPRIVIQDSRMIDASKIGVNLSGVTELRSVAGCNGNTDGTGSTSCYQQSASQWYNAKTWDASAVAFKPAAGADYKSNWNYVEVELQLNTVVGGIGQRDGVVRYWLNGDLKLERTNVLFRTGANPTLKFRQFLLTPYIGDGSPVAQTMWIDDLTLATARLSAPPAPAAPPPAPAPAPVATVTVSPSSSTIAIGGTAQLTAVARDSAGAVLTGRVTTWNSSAPTVATVVNGLVAAVAAGQATITATSEGRSGSATVTVPAPVPAPPPPTSASYPNEPAGAVPLIDWDFDVTRAGNPPFFYIARGAATTVTDATAPVNPNKVGRIQFDPGLQAGTGPSILASSLLPPTGWKSWYFSMWWKVSSNYINEMSFPGLKIWDMLTSGPYGSIIIQLYGRGAPFKMLLSLQSNGITDTYGSISLQRNTWYQVELLVTDQGNGMARYQLFVNGQRDIDRVMPKVTNAEFKHNWVMGGGPGTITTTSYIYHDHTRLSYTR